MGYTLRQPLQKTALISTLKNVEKPVSLLNAALELCYNCWKTLYKRSNHTAIANTIMKLAYITVLIFVCSILGVAECEMSEAMQKECARCEKCNKDVVRICGPYCNGQFLF